MTTVRGRPWRSLAVTWYEVHTTAVLRVGVFVLVSQYRLPVLATLQLQSRARRPEAQSRHDNFAWLLCPRSLFQRSCHFMAVVSRTNRTCTSYARRSAATSCGLPSSSLPHLSPSLLHARSCPALRPSIASHVPVVPAGPQVQCGFLLGEVHLRQRRRAEPEGFPPTGTPLAHRRRRPSLLMAVFPIRLCPNTGALAFNF